MKKFLALYKVFLIDAFNDKFAFIYNLLFPAGFFLFSNWNRLFGTAKTLTSSQIMDHLLYYWAYIVFTTVLNSIIFVLINQRETGYFKSLYFIAGSRRILLLTELAVQGTVLLAEIFCFDLVAFLVFHTFAASVLFGSLFAALLMLIPVTMFTTIFLVLRIKTQSMVVISTVTVFAAFSLVAVDASNVVGKFLLAMNPIQYLAQGFVLLGTFFHSNGGAPIMQFLIITLIYLAIGIWCLSKFDVNPIVDRA